MFKKIYNSIKLINIIVTTTFRNHIQHKLLKNDDPFVITFQAGPDRRVKIIKYKWTKIKNNLCNVFVKIKLIEH